MTQMFGSPSSYVQGKDVLFDSVKYLEKFGSRAVLISDNMVYNIVGQRFESYLTKNGFTITRTEFQGEASPEEIDRITNIGKKAAVNFIIGLGGGKTLDSAKAVADNLGIAVAILPSLASTDAPCSRLSVIYNEDGSFKEYRFYDKNPNLVLVDTRLVAGAPVRLLASGIADALATNVESQAVAKGDSETMLGAKQTLVGNAIAQKCEETLFKYGHLAIESVKKHTVTSALNKVIEANTLMSGVGFESGGLAAAHAIHDGLTVLDGPIHDLTHGEKVAFGTLTQLFLEGCSEEKFNRYLSFDLSLGLPTTFEDLKIPKVTDEELLKVAERATSPADTMNRMPFTVTADDIVQAMRGVDAYSHAFKEKHAEK